MKTPCKNKCQRGFVLTEEGRTLCKFIQRHMNYEETATGYLYLRGENKC